MNSLPSLHVLLLLLALHAPWAQGRPLNTMTTQSAKNYGNMIIELKTILKETTVSPQQPVDSNEDYILREGDQGLNLDAFLKAVNNFKDKNTKIVPILQELKNLLSTASSTASSTIKPIHIKNDWQDFLKKIFVFLRHLEDVYNLN